MPRGKVSVQHELALRPDIVRMLDGRADIAIFPGVDPANQETPLAAHLVDQLRLAYDELLNEPVPSHLQRLLAELGKAEEKS
jgi:hypothetical protein